MKWKAPENAGPGVSIGGQWFETKEAEDGSFFVETPEDGDYGTPMSSLGYVGIPMSLAEQIAAATDGAGEAGSDPALVVEPKDDDPAAEGAGTTPEVTPVVGAENGAGGDPAASAADAGASGEAIPPVVPPIEPPVVVPPVVAKAAPKPKVTKATAAAPAGGKLKKG